MINRKVEFCFEGKTYFGDSAAEIVIALQRDCSNREAAKTLRGFLRYSFNRLKDAIPQRDLQITERLDDEALALNFLCLCDEYGEGKLVIR